MSRRENAGIVNAALKYRPADPEKWLFVLKRQINRQTHKKGIACAVTYEENGTTGGQRFLLLTCESVTNQQDNLSAYSLRKNTKPIENVVPLEDDTFSFIPLRDIPDGCTCLPLKSMEDKRDICQSYIIKKSSFKPVYWRYSSKDNKYELKDRQDLVLEKAVGSPVFWTDNNKQTPYVVGVVCVSRKDGTLRPEFLTERSLQTPGKKKKRN